MALPHLLFAHGWGYDANVWGPVRSRLGDPACTLWERGYFHEPGFTREPREDAPPAPYVAVGHSFGVMHLLKALPPGAIGFISVCGFARFSAAEGYAGTPVRVIDRMLQRFDSAPGTVVGEFRGRCGSPPTRVYDYNGEALREDLVVLRDEDYRAEAAALQVPVLSLFGGADQVVSRAMTQASFPTAEHLVAPLIGHLLPVRAPEWCTRQIADFAGRLGA